MSSTPKPNKPQHPSENPNSAYSILQDLRANGTQVTPTQVTARPNTPSTTFIHTTTTTADGTPRAPGTQVPRPRPLPAQNPTHPRVGSSSTLPLQQALTPDSITVEDLQNRLAELLRDRCPTFQSHVIATVANRLTLTVISTGKSGKLGPLGLSHVSNIFTCIAHKGPKHHMCIAIAAPGAGNVKLLLHGELCEKTGLDPMEDEGMMEMCRVGFEKVVRGMYESLVPVRGRLSGEDAKVPRGVVRWM